MNWIINAYLTFLIKIFVKITDLPLEFEPVITLCKIFIVVVSVLLVLFLLWLTFSCWMWIQ